MKNLLKTVSLAALLVSAAVTQAQANNAHVEEAIRSFGDLSMFYQAMLNTGVLSELREDQHYTIFAPVNASFEAIQPRAYPCFYAVECRPQIAQLLHNHIVPGGHDLKDLVSYGQGIQTEGTRSVLVEQPYIGQYTVDGRPILTKAEVAGNVIYRINGVLTDPDEMSRFQTASYIAPAGTVTTRRTVSYQTPNYPAGTMQAVPASPDEDVIQRTTITHTYSTEE